MAELTETARRSTGKYPIHYVQLEPAGSADASPRTIVMVHGGAHTGDCYLKTADHRPGWGPHFAEAGWRVLVPDWPGIGQSVDACRPEDVSGEVVVEALAGLIDEAAPQAAGGRIVLMTHSMSGAFGWRLVEERRERIETVVGIAPAPPGNIALKPEVLSDTDAGLHLRNAVTETVLRRNEPSVPTRAFVENKLLGPGNRFPRAHLDRYADSMIPIPWGLIHQRWNYGDSQIKVEHPERLAGFPVFMMTGSHDLEHTRAMDGAVAEWLTAQGAETEFLFLSDIGIEGNGHMLMLEENSDELADIILQKLR